MYNGSNEGMQMGLTTTTTKVKGYVDQKVDVGVGPLSVKGKVRESTDGVTSAEGGVKVPLKLGVIPATGEVKVSASSNGERKVTGEIASPELGGAKAKVGVSSTTGNPSSRQNGVQLNIGTEVKTGNKTVNSSVWFRIGGF